MGLGIPLVYLCFIVAAVVLALSFVFTVAAAVAVLVIILVKKNKEKNVALADAVNEAVDSADNNA